MLRRPLLALVAATLLCTAACSAEGSDTSGTSGDTSGAAQPADAATGDTGEPGTADTAVGGGGSNPSDVCERIAERPMTDDPVDAAEHLAGLQDVLPQHLRGDAALLEQAYRELADDRASASALDENDATRAAAGDLVEYQKAVCFG